MLFSEKSENPCRCFLSIANSCKRFFGSRIVLSDDKCFVSVILLNPFSVLVFVRRVRDLSTFNSLPFKSVHLRASASPIRKPVRYSVVLQLLLFVGGGMITYFATVEYCSDELVIWYKQEVQRIKEELEVTAEAKVIEETITAPAETFAVVSEVARVEDKPNEEDAA